MIKRKGVALLWSVVLCSVLLLISSTMVSYIIKESRFSINIEDSTKAYSMAKTGIDYGLIKVRSDQAGSFELDVNNDGPLETTVEVIKGSACHPDSDPSVLFCVSSTSSHNDVTRKLEHYIRNRGGTFIDFCDQDSGNCNSTDILTTSDVWESGKPVSTKQAIKCETWWCETLENYNLDTNTGSFSLQFDMWTEPSDTTPVSKMQDTMFGVNAVASNPYLRSEVNALPYIALRTHYLIDKDGVQQPTYKDNPNLGHLSLETRDTNNNISSELLRDVSGNPYNVQIDATSDSHSTYRLTIKYVNKSFASLTLEKDSGGGIYSCAAYAEIPLETESFGDLSTLYWWTSPDVQMRKSIVAMPSNIIPEGDGSFIMLGYTDTRLRIDSLIFKN